MRPGPIRPGDSRGVVVAPGHGLHGFNEARADSPGRLSMGCPSPFPPEGCFNEARADSPGRFTGPPRPLTRFIQRFNEARADSPGRF